jgi:mersacidin/lichenicidin family type 2 lantibiotic
MSRLDIIRAWKDEEYRLTLSAAELALLPDNPAGIIDLADTDLEEVTGASTERAMTLGCCNGLTTDTCWCSFWCTLDCSATRSCGGPLPVAEQDAAV